MNALLVVYKWIGESQNIMQKNCEQVETFITHGMKTENLFSDLLILQVYTLLNFLWGTQKKVYF